MQIDHAERHIAGIFNAHHDHTGYPEKKDIVAGLHHRRRVEILQIFSLVGPAQCRVRPEPGAEPGIQHVGSCTRSLLPHLVHLVGTSTDTIISPQAWQYQTGMRCPHQSWRLMHQSRIFSIQFRYTLVNRSGMILILPSLTASIAGAASGGDFNEPLLAGDRLNNSRAALAMPDGVRVVFNFIQQTFFLQVFYHLLTAFEAV